MFSDSLPFHDMTLRHQPSSRTGQAADVFKNPIGSCEVRYARLIECRRVSRIYIPAALCGVQRFADTPKPISGLANEFIGASANFLAFAAEIIQALASSAAQLFPSLRAGTRRQQKPGKHAQADADKQVRHARVAFASHDISHCFSISEIVIECRRRSKMTRHPVIAGNHETIIIACRRPPGYFSCDGISYLLIINY
jgi:hypothetical protein